MDQFLRRQPLCSECYQHFSFEELKNAEVDKCFHPGCTGIFWKASGSGRKPAKYAVYTRVTASLRRLLLRPDFLHALQAGRQDHDTHRAGPSDVLNDVCDGSAWNSGKIGLKRVWKANGKYMDQPIVENSPESTPNIISLGYGLHGAVNIDWFSMTDKHSVGAIYLSFLNLHRSLRYRPENTILACVIPGPGEPHLEQLNEILDPLIDEFKTLYASMYLIYSKYVSIE